jgi:hypothetical protein
MSTSSGSRVLASLVIAMQICGPGLLWALEQRGVEVRRTNRAVVSGLRGSDLTVRTGDTTKPVRFSEPIAFGEPLQTARDSAAEVLINNQAVVTVLSESDVALEERDGNTVVHLNKGSVLVSAAASALREGQLVIVETPGVQLATRGGRLKATVGVESQRTEISPSSVREARAYRVAQTPVRPMQAPATRPPIRFEVYEGQGQISAGAAPLVLDAGQAVQVVEGSVSPAPGAEQAAPGSGPLLLAATQHASTPQTGLDLVSQRQMQQVSALQQALFGAPDTQIEGKESESGAIISTLFGSGPTGGQSTQSQQSSQQGTQTSTQPGQTGTQPAQTGTQPGQTTGTQPGTQPGQTGTQPGQTGTQPGTQPGQTGSSPGQGGGGTTVGGGSGGPGAGDGGTGGGAGGGGSTPAPSPAPQLPPNNPLANLFGAGSPYLAALLNAINRSGTGVGGDANNGIRSLDPASGLDTGSVKGGLGLLTFTNRSGDPKTSVFHGSELLLVDSGNIAEAPHGGAAPLNTLVGFGIQDILASPLIESVNIGSFPTRRPNEAFRSGVVISDIKKLTFQPYEVTITQLPAIEGLDPLGQPIITGGTFEVRRNGQLVMLDNANALIQRENSLSAFRASGGVHYRLTADFEGVRLSVQFAEPPNVGQAFTVSAVSRTRVRDGNIEVPVNTFFNTNPIEPVIEPAAVVPVVIVRSPNDPRPVTTSEGGQGLDVNPSLNTEVDPRDAREFSVSDFSSRSDGKICQGCKVGSGNESFLDARVTARSNSNPASPVDLLGGVVLTNGTEFTLSGQITRSGGIEPSHTTPAVDGSVAAIVGTLNAPAFVQIRDRVLAVLDGSTIQPSSNNLRTSLLTVLDSQLIGPKSTIEGRRDGSLPPLLELSSVDTNGNPLIDGNGKPVQSIVTATSAAVVRSSGAATGLLDRALLEASSPILTLAHSQMTATGHLVDLAGGGPNEQNLLRANLKPNNSVVPFDALVRVDRGSALNVAGNLLNLANRASATVNGYLFSLANNSSINIGGTLVSLTGNSVLRLNSDAFGVFDQTANSLKLSNTLCAGGECGLLTDHLNAPFQSRNGKPLRVSGSKTNVALPQGFSPFRATGGTDTRSQVLVDEHTALVHVEPGSALHISVPLRR